MPTPVVGSARRGLAQLGQLPPLSPVGKVPLLAIVQMAASACNAAFGRTAVNWWLQSPFGHSEGDLPLLKTFKGEIVTPKITGIS